MYKQLSLIEIQEIEFSILKKFHDYCRDKNLKYSLAYGTLIGAVRHQRFIPWDDDIDVMMPRNDYEKLIEAFKNGNGIHGYEILCKDNSSNYYYPFIKICDVNTIAKMEDNQTIHGIWMDVFPVDYIPDNEVETKRLHKKIRFYKNLIIAYTTDFNSKDKNWKFVPKYFYAMFARIKGIDKIIDLIEKESIKYNEEKTNSLSVLTWQSSLAGRMSVDDFVNLKKIKFCDNEFFIIDHYDAYLRGIYGDYMKIPKENKRKIHHLEAYLK